MSEWSNGRATAYEAVKHSNMYGGSSPSSFTKMDTMIVKSKKEVNNYNKLSEREVVAISKLIDEDNLSLRKIGKMFDTSHHTVSNIKNGKSHKKILKLNK